MSLSKSPECCAADKAQFAVAYSSDRRGSWQAIDHREIPDHGLWREKCENALLALRRPQYHLERTRLESIASIAVISRLKQHIPGLKLLGGGARKQFGRQRGGQA
jgi:hypothetical protein